MSLPNYFLADLPAGAEITPAMLQEACQTLLRNRDHYLAGKSSSAIIRILADLGERWLQPDFEFRQMALHEGPAHTGFSPGTLAAGLDHFFGQLTADHLKNLLTQDLGHALRLDQPSITPSESVGGRASLACGPELLVHLAAGNVPNPAWMSLITGLLVRSAQLMKCAHGTSFLPRLFAHSLYQAEPKLAACLEIAEWPSTAQHLNAALFSEADCVTVTGSDETLHAVRQALPPSARFLGYGYRLSFAYLTRDVLRPSTARTWAHRLAEDVAAWNQLGCLSPHAAYVEDGGLVSPEQFAEILAEELAHVETLQPRGPIPVEIAAGIAARRHLFEIRAAHSDQTKLWQSRDSTAWTVVFEGDPLFQISCLHRFVHVKAVAQLADALHGADALRGHVSTVGLAAADEKTPALVQELGRWGVSRVCPVGRMQRPPLSWRHDGRPPLGDLVTWTDWESDY